MINTNKSNEHSALYYASFIILQGLIFGIGNPIVKFAYESITPIWCLTIRFTIASLIFAIFFGKQTARELKENHSLHWLLTALCTATAYITCNVALNLTSATSVGFLMSLPIVFTPPLSYIVLKRKIRKNFIPVPILAVIGLYLISMNTGTFHLGTGEILSLICSLAMAGALVWGENSLNNFSPATVSFLQMGVTAIAGFVCALFLEPIPVLSAVEPKAWYIILYLAIFSSCVCYILQNVALAHISAAVVALTQCSEPIFTAIFAFFLLNERLSLFGIFGVILLLICIVYGNYTENNNIEKSI